MSILAAKFKMWTLTWLDYLARAFRPRHRYSYPIYYGRHHLPSVYPSIRSFHLVYYHEIPVSRVFFFVYLPLTCCLFSAFLVNSVQILWNPMWRLHTMSVTLVHWETLSAVTTVDPSKDAAACRGSLILLRSQLCPSITNVRSYRGCRGGLVWFEISSNPLICYFGWMGELAKESNIIRTITKHSVKICNWKVLAFQKTWSCTVLGG